MKAKQLVWMLLLILLGVTACRQATQQPDADGELLTIIRASAAKGDAEGQLVLGRAYFYGNLGVPKDEAEGVKWYRKAAEQNHAPAQKMLGFCYDTGQGVPKDYLEAVKWYRKAADQNYAPAQYRLGFCYDTGQGVPKDYLEAYKWLLLAAAQGDEDAKKAVPDLEDKMTREQIADGQKLARNFKPRVMPPADGR